MATGPVALPPGFVLDEAPATALPPGFQIDQPQAAPSRFAQSALNLSKGLITGGPLGLVTAGAGEATRGLDEAGETAGGAVTDAAARVLPAEVAGALGAATKVGLPAAVGGLGGGAAGKPVMEAGAKRLMQSSLRPGSKSLANDNAAKAIQTMLEEGVSATTGGAVRLRMMINKLKAKVGQMISQADGALVDKAHVYRELASKLDEVTKQGTPNAARGAVMRAWDEFTNHPLLQGEMRDLMAAGRGPNQIPVQLADDLKRGTQKAVKDAYGRVTTTPADDQAQMAIATGLRKGIEEAVPGVGAVNAKLSEYINALHQIEPRAAMEANKQLGGLVPLAHSPEAAMLMLADRNPWMKSLIARILYRGRSSIPAGAGAMTAVGEQ